MGLFGGVLSRVGLGAKFEARVGLGGGGSSSNESAVLVLHQSDDAAKSFVLSLNATASSLDSMLRAVLSGDVAQSLRVESVSVPPAATGVGACGLQDWLHPTVMLALLCSLQDCAELLANPLGLGLAGSGSAGAKMQHYLNRVQWLPPPRGTEDPAGTVRLDLGYEVHFAATVPSFVAEWRASALALQQQALAPGSGGRAGEQRSERWATASVGVDARSDSTRPGRAFVTVGVVLAVDEALVGRGIGRALAGAGGFALGLAPLAESVAGRVLMRLLGNTSLASFPSTGPNATHAFWNALYSADGASPGKLNAPSLEYRDGTLVLSYGSVATNFVVGWPGEVSTGGPIRGTLGWLPTACSSALELHYRKSGLFYDLGWHVGVSGCEHDGMLKLLGRSPQQASLALHHHSLSLSFTLALPGIGSASRSGCSVLAPGGSGGRSRVREAFLHVARCLSVCGTCTGEGCCADALVCANCQQAAGLPPRTPCRTLASATDCNFFTRHGFANCEWVERACPAAYNCSTGAAFGAVCESGG